MCHFSNLHVKLINGYKWLYVVEQCKSSVHVTGSPVLGSVLDYISHTWACVLQIIIISILALIFTVIISIIYNNVAEEVINKGEKDSSWLRYRLWWVFGILLPLHIGFGIKQLKLIIFEINRWIYQNLMKCLAIYKWIPLKLDFLEAWKSVQLKSNLAYPVIFYWFKQKCCPGKKSGLTRNLD